MPNTYLSLPLLVITTAKAANCNSIYLLNTNSCSLEVLEVKGIRAIQQTKELYRFLPTADSASPMLTVLHQYEDSDSEILLLETSRREHML